MPRIEGVNYVNQNLIYNPEGYLFQRLTAPATPTAVNTDNYGPDRWNVLCSANAVNVSQSTDAPSGCENAMLLTKATAGGYFGICQMFENAESVPLRNKTVTVGLQVKGTSGVTQVRVSVLGWTGTADTITSAIVSSWASTPSYIANVTQYATGLFSVSTGYNQISLQAPIDGACNNLMVFIHTPNSQSVNDSLYVSQVRMNVGTFLNAYQRRQNAEENTRCLRYCFQLNGTSNVGVCYVSPPGGSPFTFNCVGRHPVRMRVAPSLSYSSSSGFNCGGASATVSSTGASADDFTISGTCTGSVTSWGAINLGINSGQYLRADAEL